MTGAIKDITFHVFTKMHIHIHTIAPFLCQLGCFNHKDLSKERFISSIARNPNIDSWIGSVLNDVIRAGVFFYLCTVSSNL